MIFSFLFIMAVVFIGIAGQWKTFEKAGQPGWACIIPFYNIYIMTKIAGKPSYWLLLMCIPGVNVIFAVWLVNMISKSFGNDEGFTLGLIFLGFIFWPILGFGASNYIGPYGDRAAFRAAQDGASKFDFERK